jgi:hypothetical protein
MKAPRKRQGFLFQEQVATKLQQLADKRCTTMTAVLTQLIMDDHKREFAVRKQYVTKDQQAAQERMARKCYMGQTFDFTFNKARYHWHVGADGEPSWGPWLTGEPLQGVFVTLGEGQQWCEENGPPPAEAREIPTRSIYNSETGESFHVPTRPDDYDLYVTRTRAMGETPVRREDIFRD